VKILLNIMCFVYCVGFLFHWFMYLCLKSDGITAEIVNYHVSAVFDLALLIFFINELKDYEK